MFIFNIFYTHEGSEWHVLVAHTHTHRVFSSITLFVTPYLSSKRAVTPLHIGRYQLLPRLNPSWAEGTALELWSEVGSWCSHEMRWAKWRGIGSRVAPGSREWTSFPGPDICWKWKWVKQTRSREGLHIHRLLDLAIFQCSKFKTAGSSALFLGEVQKVLFEMVSYLGKAVWSHVNMPFLEKNILEEQLMDMNAFKNFHKQKIAFVCPKATWNNFWAQIAFLIVKKLAIRSAASMTRSDSRGKSPKEPSMEVMPMWSLQVLEKFWLTTQKKVPIIDVFKGSDIVMIFFIWTGIGSLPKSS